MQDSFKRPCKIWAPYGGHLPAVFGHINLLIFLNQLLVRLIWGH